MNIAGTIRQLKLLHTFLLVVLVLGIIGASVYAANTEMPQNEDLERTGSVVAVIISVACLLAGFNIFKKKMLEARNEETPVVRVRKYLAACIIWWALIEFPAILSVVLFLQTGYYSFIALSTLHWLILLVFMPRKSNIAVLLRLTEKDL